LYAEDQTLQRPPLLRAVSECVRNFFRVGLPSYDVAGRFVACFKDAGLPEPTLIWESLAFGSDAAPRRWLVATFQALRLHIERAGLFDPRIGDTETLFERLQAETGVNDQIVTFPQVAAWALKP